MLRPMSPKVTVSSIPSITTLRRELDYGDSRLPRCGAFNDDMNAFRKKFITSRGVAGPDLFNWNSEEAQDQLAEVTSAYLDGAGNGPRFWPDDKSAANYNKYQYSKHGSQIKRHIKQLFFRLNQQQYRNHKYKKKPGEEEPRRDESLLQEEEMKCELPDGTGEMPLRLHADKSNTGFFGSDTEDSQSSGSSDEFPSLSSLLARNDRRDKRSSTIHTSVGSPIQDLRGVDSGDEDIYSGLPSPKCLPRTNQPKFTNQTAPRNKRGQPFEDALGGQAQPKRQKQTKPLVKDVILSTTLANRPQRQLQPRKPDEFIRDLDEISRHIDPDSEPNSATDTPIRSRHKQPTVIPHPKTPRAASGSEDSDGHPVSAGRDRGPKQIYSPQTRITAFFRPPTFLTSPSNPLGLAHTAASGAHTPPPHTTPAALPNNILPSSSLLGSPSAATPAPSRAPASPTTLISPTSVRTTAHTTETTAMSTTTPHKPPVLFTYRLILTRHPHTVTSRWAPAGGRFSDKTLAQLRRELPFSSDSPESPGLIFYIVSQCMRSVERIAYDDEDGFETMKRYISMEVGAWMGRRKRGGEGPKRSPTGERLIIDIFIERMAVPRSGEEDDGIEDQGWLEELETVEW